MAKSSKVREYLCSPRCTLFDDQGLVPPGQKGRAAFCEVPGHIQKEKRKTTDYSDVPLTAHGEMMLSLIRSGISAYPHPTVAMQFFERAARYSEARKQCIIPVIEALVDTR